MNLPAKDKWIDPAYQDVPKEKIPTITQDNLTVRVIAGEAYGTKAIVNTRVPIQFLDVHLLAGGEFRHEIPSYVVFPSPDLSCISSGVGLTSITDSTLAGT